MFLSKEDCHRLLSWKSGMERESKLSQNSFWCILYTAKHIFCAHISCEHILDFTYFCAHTSVHLFLCTRSTYMQEQKNIRVQYPLTTLSSSSFSAPLCLQTFYQLFLSQAIFNTSGIFNCSNSLFSIVSLKNLSCFPI